ncbi:MAG: C25 family cysteine peptidase [Bacteroidota bacterium]
MIKRLLIICFLSFTFIGLEAQPYGNEWINYSQKYYKIKIAQNGVYRIDSSTLAAAGIPLSTIDPRKFQLFNKGMQQFIYVWGENDGVFNGSDFIEFYAQKNDGALDSLLYTNTPFVPNPFYSLINDTAVYFLTWNSSFPNNRMLSETDTAFSSYTPDNYFFKEEIKSFAGDYYDGESNGVVGSEPGYTRSEGWFDANVINLGAAYTYSGLLNTSNAYTAGPSAKIKTVVVGASKAQIVNFGLNDHHLTIHYKDASGVYQQLTDTLFKGYESNRFTYDVSIATLGMSFTDFKYTSVADAGFTSNRTVVSYIYIKYPHTFNLEGKNNFLMYVPQNTSQSKCHLNISNFNATDTVRLYDLSNRKRVHVVQSGSNYKALLPNSGSEKKCFITSDANIIKITSLQPVTASAQFTNYSTLAVNSAFIIVTHKSLMTSAISYKNYRASSPGGSHNVIIADIDELYDQFAYGIVKSPLSIRGFSDYLLDTYPSPPQNLFLLGKSIHMRDSRNNGANYMNDLVPSFGNPSSDNLITAGLNGTMFEPAIPTGRLAAKNTTDIDLYLNKIKDYEATPPGEWKKHVLHFGGGINSGEQNTFKAYLNGYKNIIEDTLYGGVVIKEFFKNSPAPIQSNLSDEFKKHIENGVSLMTFFGHTSAQTFDQSMDELTNYTPLQGRYPFLLVNGCYAGDIHATDLSTSEKFTLAADRGVIGYLASVGLGMSYALNFFSSEFYNQIGRTNYGKGVGSSIKQSIRAIQTLAVSDVAVKITCVEMNLHCDPSLKINMHDKPDHKITNNDVFFDVTTQTDSFTVYAARTNLGKAVRDSTFTELMRTLPDGKTVTYLLRNKFTRFKDTVSFKIPIDFTRDVGLNKIRITLDRNNELDELSETNNTTTDIDMLINGDNIVPVYPYQFAIVPAKAITLKASTANPFAASKNYIFQIDTADTFNSPVMLSYTVIAPGGVVQWVLPAAFTSTITDSTVYYWRVSPDSTSALSGYIWRESSFQYISGKRGWEQAHFFQFKNNGYQYVKFNRPQRKFDFVNDIKTIECVNGIPPNAIRYDGIIYKMNGATQYVSSWVAPGPGFTFAVFDPVSGNPWQSIALGGGVGQHGNVTNGPVGLNENAFDFIESNPTSRATITSFINNIPNGHYVLAYSQDLHNIPQYEDTLYSAFESLGSSQIRSVPAARPYILFGRKGNAIGVSREIIGDTLTSVIQLDTSITTSWSDGYIASPVIGPAKSWGSLHWRQKTLDGASTADVITVQVIGIMENGTESIRANFPKDSLDILNLSSYVNVDSFPRIRLVAYKNDDSLNTPPQLKRWHVVYDPVPEAAINPPLGYLFANDTLQEGDNLNIHLPIQNISEYDFTDSLLITYWMEDANRVNHPLPSKLKKKPFVGAEVIVDSININTTTFQGNNALWVEVNPVNQPKSQLEQHHFNNIIRIPFYTAIDRINPLLDVTFDGVHILNNDIVSASPNILIKLKDENQFLALNDTNDFKVFIQSPSSSIAKRIYFGNEMSFTPAVLPNNSCKINCTPSLPQDGTYQLIVQAKDKSDNLSGALDYKISFEIISRASITEVMNYPNPFSTATRFVFTLTGSDVPTYFKIQILTITGKVVREINKEELGLLHVGRNITDYAWDGKDEFGDQLANGVYLYRVISSINGWTIEKRQSEADQYFKKGFGKMYLMR